MAYTYLVTGVGGQAGRSLAIELYRQGRAVVGVDMQRVTGLPFPAEQVMAAQSPRFVSGLFEIARAYRAQVIVPTVTEELTVLAAVKQTAGRAGIAVAVGDQLAVNAASDKWLTFQCLQMMSVAVPRTILASDALTVTSIADTLGLPVLRKPRIGRGAREVSVHQNVSSVLSGLSNERYVLQEFLPGIEYAVNLYLWGEGGVAGAVLRKTELKHGAYGNGLTVCRVQDIDIWALGVMAARAIGLTGPADIDIRRRADGTPAVLEINARYGAHCGQVPEVVAALMKEHEINAPVG
jgi:carbamoylphosphate synthase large subunit